MTYHLCFKVLKVQNLAQLDTPNVLSKERKRENEFI